MRLLDFSDGFTSGTGPSATPFPNGTVAAPSVAVGQATKGLYHYATDELGISVGAAAIARITTSYLYSAVKIMAGSLTVDPIAVLHGNQTSTVYWNGTGFSSGGTQPPITACVVDNRNPGGYDPVFALRQATSTGVMKTTVVMGAVGTNTWDNAVVAQQTSDFYLATRDEADALAERIRIDKIGSITLGSSTSSLHNLKTATASTVGAAGGGSALPATPIGYVRIKVNGTEVKIPYFTA